MLFRKAIPVIFVMLLIVGIFPAKGLAWGTWGHLSISSSAIEDLPLSMATVFRPYKSWIANTCTDNGVRTGWDPHETDFHYIDLGGTNTGSCQWPNFGSCMPQTQAAFLSTYGYSSLGFNCYIVDSITVVLSTAYRNWKNNPTGSNFTTSMLWMCRVAHYMEDLSQPLHVSWNYNPDNVHSRYETDMLNTYKPGISTSLSSGAIYQSNVLQYAFTMASTSYQYANVIASADTTAKNAAGGSTSNGTYYTYLWESTRSFTTTLLNQSAISVASIWYTAWINAGLATAVPVELSDFSVVDMDIEKPSGK